ncbi:hypothetical protein O181_011979 [Austropuccinia psidii MF-1]|uniref:Uncharacterized protein n=1 Tax=Austropuccinia psidii MF-1 TaxID=1389203 RepID=A0A9Q3BVI1_9BASI|nr:hypothetical protein [Austropuccinia psidii MF-1]
MLRIQVGKFCFSVGQSPPRDDKLIPPHLRFQTSPILALAVKDTVSNEYWACAAETTQLWELFFFSLIRWRKPRKNHWGRLFDTNPTDLSEMAPRHNLQRPLPRCGWSQFVRQN